MKENIKYFETIQETNGYIINDIPFTCYNKENGQVLFNNKPNKMLIIDDGQIVVHEAVNIVFETLNDADGYIIEIIPFSCYIKENLQFLEYNQENCKIVVEDRVAIIKERGNMIRYTATSKITPNLSALPPIISNDFDPNTGNGVIKFATDVTIIGDYAFRNCRGLTSVTIPGSVASIGNYAFSGCAGLTSIDVASDNCNYCSVDGVLFNKDKTTLIEYPAGKQGTYTIPNSVTSIGGRAFENCSSLTSITIPNSITNIGGYAFSSCKGLTSVTIPNSVTSIGNLAFYNCSGLTSVTIPDSVTSIGGSAFENCSSLTSITIPNSITWIVDYVFRYCSGLTSIEIPNSVTGIGRAVFERCTGLTSATIPNNVRYIETEAFMYCWGLTSISYIGTISQYKSITKGSNWHTGVPATVVHCTNGDTPI